MQLVNIILFYLFIGIALATNYYVSPTGLDTNDCSQAQPCQTIAHCLTLPADSNKAINISLAAGNYTDTNCGVSLTAVDTYDSIFIGGPYGAPLSVNFSCGQANSHFTFEHLTSTEITLAFLTLRKGTNSGGGGCVYASNVKRLTLTNMTIAECTTGSNGGALFSDSPTYIDSSDFFGNSAAAAGGAMYLQSTSNGSSITNSYIHMNTAGLGAGLYLYGGYLFLQGSIVENNNALLYGGGLFLATPTPTKAGDLNFLNTNFTHNNATLQGAGVYASNLNHSFNIDGALFVDNWDGKLDGDSNIACNSSAMEFCYACTAKDCTSECVVGSQTSCSQNTTDSARVLCYGSKFTMCSDVTCVCHAKMPKVEKILIVVIALLLTVGVVLIVVDVVRYILKKRQQNNTYTPIK